ncbi:MAG: hypothetical protein M9894_06795 [Planctomycetes bacterium]|nr:hypothetical protein [Planctomycetota bacterium]
MSAPPAPRPRVVWRTWLYPIVLLAASGSLAALERDPQHEVDAVAQVAARAEEGLFFHHEAAALGMLPGHGWTLTVYVGDLRRFAPAKFLVVSKVDGRLRGEMILDGVTPGGALRTAALEGTALDRYLNHAMLDLREVDRAFKAGFAAPRPYVPPGRAAPEGEGEAR